MIQYSVEDAAMQAEIYCKNNPGWVRICDVDSDELDVRFHELPQREQSRWEKHNPLDPEGSWQEFGTKYSKHPYAFVTGAGDFVAKASRVPLGHQSMMIFNVKKKKRQAY